MLSVNNQNELKIDLCRRNRIVVKMSEEQLKLFKLQMEANTMNDEFDNLQRSLQEISETRTVLMENLEKRLIELKNKENKIIKNIKQITGDIS